MVSLYRRFVVVHNFYNFLLLTVFASIHFYLFLLCYCSESGSYSVECPIGHYCFHEHGKPTCMPKNKDSYPRQRCSAGFFGWQGNPDTCPTAFSKRETSDGHEGQAMDFRSCCRANCKDMYANCDAIDSSIPVSDDHCYPKSDGTCDQAEDCCYKTCHSWNGETCPAGTTRRSEHDRHRCHYNVCNAAECCQEPSMCEKWKNSGGTCTSEKPQHKNPDDRHHCSDAHCHMPNFISHTTTLIVLYTLSIR